MSTVNYHYAGQIIRMSSTFRDQAGDLADPDVASLMVIGPDGQEETYEPTKDDVGLYHFDLNVTESGRYQYRWSGTGAVQAAREWEFRVRPSAFTV